MIIPLGHGLLTLWFPLLAAEPLGDGMFACRGCGAGGLAVGLGHPISRILRTLAGDQAWVLWVFLALLAAVFVLRWWRSGQITDRWRAVAVLTALVLAVAVNVLVVTPQERVIRQSSRLAETVAKANRSAFADLIATDFTAAAGRLDKAGLLAYFDLAVQRLRIEELDTGQFEATVTGARATVTFQATCRVVTESEIIPRLVTRWQIQFIHRSDRWLIQSIEPLPSRTVPLTSWSQISSWLNAGGV